MIVDSAAVLCQQVAEDMQCSPPLRIYVHHKPNSFGDNVQNLTEKRQSEPSPSTAIGETKVFLRLLRRETVKATPDGVS